MLGTGQSKEAFSADTWVLKMNAHLHTCSFEMLPIKLSFLLSVHLNWFTFHVFAGAIRSKTHAAFLPWCTLG